MGLLDNFINKLRFGNDDEYEYEDEYYDEDEMMEEDIPKNENPKPRTHLFSRPKASTNNGQPKAMELVLVRPNNFEDVRDIADPLLEGKTVVVNMEGIHGELARRIIDFVSGSTYSIKGNLQKISNYIVVATPASVELSGEFAGVLSSTYENNSFSL